MATDIKTLAVMVAGAVGGVYAVRKLDILPEVFKDLTYKDALIKAPVAGMGVGKDNIPNSTYLIPAAVAAGAYFLM